MLDVNNFSDTDKSENAACFLSVAFQLTCEGSQQYWDVSRLMNISF